MSTPQRARWVRGALVGACSSVVTIGAHAGVGGGLPQGAPLILSVLVCAIIGAVLAATTIESRRARLLGVIGALVVAQSLGHITLAMAANHHRHGGGVAMAPSMVAAHVVGAVVLGVAICSVEYLYLVCTSVLCWLRLFAMAAQRPTVCGARVVTSDVVAQSVLRCSGLGMRAPPRVALAA